jgi:hypothetical protein
LSQENPIRYKRKLLKDWLALEEIRANLLEAAEQKNYSLISEGVRKYISAASDIEYKSGVWFEDLENFENAVRENLPTLKFALLRTREKGDKLPWEYEGRTWFYWLHLFSGAYGWTENQISELDIDTAIGLLQEILIEEQLRHEWEWSLTEIAYPYNSTTKKSEFKALPRPDWMKKIVPNQKVMIRADLMPQGLILGEGQTTDS